MASKSKGRGGKPRTRKATVSYFYMAQGWVERGVWPILSLSFPVRIPGMNREWSFLVHTLYLSRSLKVYCFEMI